MNNDNVAKSIMIWWLTKNKKPLKYPIDVPIPGYFKFDYFVNPTTIISDLINKKMIDVKSGYVNITECGELYMEQNKAIIWAHRNKNAIFNFEEDFDLFQLKYKNSGFVEVEDFFIDCLEHAEQKCLKNKKINSLTQIYFSLWNIYSKYYKTKQERIFKIVLILFLLDVEDGLQFAPGQIETLQKIYKLDNEVLENAIKSNEYLSVINSFPNPNELHSRLVNEFYKECL